MNLPHCKCNMQHGPNMLVPVESSKAIVLIRVLGGSRGGELAYY